MPRSGRGGVRSGTAGKSYANRSDLNAGSSSPGLPVTTVPNQPYGQAGAQAQAQAIVPLPNEQAGLARILQEVQNQPAAPTAGGAVTTQAPAQNPASSPVIGPGELGPLTGPTDRPHEPVTHGSPSGPGGGPEVLGPVPATKVSQTIAQLAQMTGNPDLQALAQHAMAQGQ